MSFASSPPGKFHDPHTTLTGAARAHVAWRGTKMLWFNTGTLCNIECSDCYIESSPKNDRLSWLGVTDIVSYLDELDMAGEGGCEIGLTGGEPFMAPEIIDIIRCILDRGFPVLVLTNAMQPMMRPRIKGNLVDINERFGERLIIRVSLDHYKAEFHDRQRGAGAFAQALKGLHWLAENKFTLTLAGRTVWGEAESESRAGYGRLIRDVGLDIDPDDPSCLVLFPEMRPGDDPPEITERCWDILGVTPDDQMCASQRMVVKRRHARKPCVVACTLLPYDQRFELGHTLAQTRGRVSLNHPYCASFCVLGGGNCAA